jgi:predicted dehydrogenase
MTFMNNQGHHIRERTDVLKVGIGGFGFMGRMHYRCWKALADVEVTAICDADPQALQDAAKSRGNIAGAEGGVDLAGVKIYGDFAQMIQHEPLHAVSITLPTHLHAKSTIAALDAGLHVLCEKPMALNLADATRMIEAARRSGKVLQIGHCIRFWPEYAKAKQIVDSGQHGRVIAATFQRLAATAARKTPSWFTNEALSGGMPLDLHIHDTDFIQYLFGMPRSVCSCGVSAGEGGLTHLVTRYGYDDDKLVTAEGGWAMMPTFGFEMRFHIALERATIAFDYHRQPALRLCLAEGEAIAPPCEEGDGYSRQIAHFAQRTGGEDVPPVTTLQQAWDSLRIVLAERESARSGCPVTLDGPGPTGGCRAR